jgi:hypothetical protein
LTLVKEIVAEDLFGNVQIRGSMNGRPIRHGGR